MSGEAVSTLSRRRYAAAERAAISLARAMKNVSFYDVSHAVVREVLREFLADLNELREERADLVMKFINGYVVIDDRPIIGQFAALGNLVGACHRRGVEAVVFRQGAGERDVERLVALLATNPAEIEKSGGINEMMAGAGIEHIAVERLGGRRKNDWRWVHAGAIDALRSAAAGVRTGRALDIASVRLSVREIVNDIVGERSLFHNLNSMKGMDEYTFIHALHICVLTVELGRQIGLEATQLEELGVAALLHNVGKIFVPLEILRKPSPLDEAEFAIMSRHSVDGAIALAGEPHVHEVAPVVAFEHHIHLDRSGYPRLRQPRQLHMYSLMVSISDVYDALTTARPYRPPLTPLGAVEVMGAEYATRLEPRLLKRFLTMLGPYPSGCLLALPDGRMAVVTRPNAAAPYDPFVRAMEEDLGRRRLSHAEVPLRELTDGPGEVAILDPVALGIDLIALFHEAATGALPDDSPSVVS